MSYRATPENIIHVAPMECAASCIMTALNIAGLNYRFYLLSYWNLNYYAKNLLSGEVNIMRNHLLYAYGTQIKCHNGNAYDLIQAMEQEQLVMFACQASKLRFFPEKFTGHEANGFQHFILLYGYQAESNRFLVIDPIADFIGEITESELRDCALKETEFIYYSLSFPQSFEQPSVSQIFKRESQINADKYTGEKAFHLFIADLEALPSWSQQERETWINQNNITITTIVKMRKMIWQSYCELNMMTATAVQAGQELVEGVVKLWMAVNFLLLKLKKKQNEKNIIAAIAQNLETLISKERECVEFIKLKGDEVVAI
ncbi:hypothetical protein ABE504_14185 [Paenibacillus oryzisoli]|uniref:hypothetical protein n=1 Tax=Paenibacillus oryzisoli TaxID=1850517 RepID=UPI003D2B7AD8